MTITHHVPHPAEFDTDVTTCGLPVTMRVNFSVTGKYVNCPDCVHDRIDAENRELVEDSSTAHAYRYYRRRMKALDRLARVLWDSRRDWQARALAAEEKLADLEVRS